MGLLAGLFVWSHLGNDQKPTIATVLSPDVSLVVTWPACLFGPAGAETTRARQRHRAVPRCELSAFLMGRFGV